MAKKRERTEKNDETFDKKKFSDLLIAVLLIAAIIALIFLVYKISVTGKAVQTLQPNAVLGKDSFIKQNEQTKNFGTNEKIEIDSEETNKEERGLLQFDLSSLPPNATINSATLYLYLDSGEGKVSNVTINRLTADWTESKVTWKSKDGTNNWIALGGDYDATPFAATAVSKTKGWYSWNITSLVQGWVDGTWPNRGMILKPEILQSGNNVKKFISSDNKKKSSSRPKLVIDYTTVNDTTPPGAVSGLSEGAAGTTWIYWTWTNPGDPDFDHVEIWINGTFMINTSNNYYNATGLNADTWYEIGIITVDSSGNADGWINDTAKTAAGCVENWIAYYSSCLINDSQLKYYLDANSCGTTINLPGDNGTYVACNYCTSTWESVNNSICYANNTFDLGYYYTNDCCAQTGLPSDCNIPSNTTEYCNYSCTPDLVNTSWSSWHDLTGCQINDTILQERNRVQYDSNFCGWIANQTFYEHQEIICNYCSEDITGPFNTTCNTSDQLTQHYIDNNYATCCAATGLDSDCHIDNGSYDNQTFSCTYDAIAPVISNVDVATTSSSATVTWTTDEPSNSSIEYGKTTALGTIKGDNNLILSHSIVLTGLSANTKYYYEVTSCDISGNCNTTDILTFTTKASGGGGGGGGGGAGGAPAINISIQPNATAVCDLTVPLKENKKGTCKLSENENIYFKFKDKAHSIKITGIGSDNVELAIYSAPQKLTLATGESEEIDLDSDKQNDVSVKLESIKNGSATITISVLTIFKPAGACVCPECGNLSECAYGKQSRTCYACGPETNFTCKSYVEEQACGGAFCWPCLYVPITIIVLAAAGAWYGASRKKKKKVHPHH